MEKNTMVHKPRPFSITFFNWSELATSIIQGLMITAGALLVYKIAVWQGFNEAITRTMVFTVLIAANVLLTLVNRSFHFSVFSTLKYKNNLVPLIIGITVASTTLLLFVDPWTRFFEFERLDLLQLSISIFAGFTSVIWYEMVKWWKRVQV